jgi:hypothetical protein
MVFTLSQVYIYDIRIVLYHHNKLFKPNKGMHSDGLSPTPLMPIINLHN